MSRRVWLYGALAGTTAVLVMRFWLADVWYGALFALAGCAAWGVGEWRGWDWLDTLGFVSIVLAAVGSAFLADGEVWSITAVVLALIAWELGRFDSLLNSVSRVENETAISRQHTIRLLAVAGTGFLLAFSTTLFRPQFGFLMALPLACLSIVGFSLAISFLRRHSD